MRVRRRRYRSRQAEAHAHCCVPLCRSSSRSEPATSLHSFPQEPQLRRRWLSSLRREPPVVTSPQKVCSRHFRQDDIICNASRGGSRLKPGAVPSLFPWNNFTMEKEEEEEEEGRGARRAPPEEERPAAAAERRGLGADSRPLFLQRFAASPEDIRFYTRFSSLDRLMAFWALIEPATSWMSRAKRERDDKLIPIDEFFLFLNCLSTGRSQRELGRRFNIQQSSVGTILISWAHFLHRLLGSVCIWMTPDKVKGHLPLEFREHTDTQVVVDFVELHCQALSSRFASGRSHLTSKALVAMAPHGAVTFVSALHEGFVSDKEMFRRSGIVPLLSPAAAVMVLKDFPVEELVPGKVHRLDRSSESGRAVADHAEKLFQRILENKLFETNIPLNISGSVGQLFTVACLLCNYQHEPLGKKWQKGKDV